LIDWGLAQLASRGATRALVLMGDLPRVTQDDVQALCVALATHQVVAAADRHGRSTNALGLHLPFPAATAFGDPESYARHLATVRQHGWCVSEIANPRLAYDMDHPDDIIGTSSFGT
jgi:2-phospho-L-lactate guanylyltransferase (CobY/MobA/RfbA family)